MMVAQLAMPSSRLRRMLTDMSQTASSRVVMSSSLLPPPVSISTLGRMHTCGNREEH